MEASSLYGKIESMTLKHTQFMQKLSERIEPHLRGRHADFQIGEKRWFCQVYFSERGIHYEVSRPYNREGRQLEIGLHFETRDKERNLALLRAFDHHLIELRDGLGQAIKAEIWDRGWTKVYEIHPDQELTESWVEEIAERFAQFIQTLQPILARIEGEP